MKINTIFKSCLSSILLLSAIIFTVDHTQAQEVKRLTMEECIDIALSNNISLQRTRNNALIAESNRKQALLNFLPNLQARINYDFYTGTFFDTNIGRQVTSASSSSGPNINTNIVIFNGLSNHHNRKQRENEFRASKLDVEDGKQAVTTEVIGLYLNVAAGGENIKISENRIDLLTQQLEREEKREKAGVGKIEEIYNLRSQVANERLNLVTLQNTYERSKLLLLQALQLENVRDIEIAKPEIDESDLNENVESYETVIQQATDYSPALKSANYNMAAAKSAFGVARSARYPTLTAFGQVGSNYSSNGATNPQTGDPDPDATFFDQLDFNQYEYFNFSLSIPIFTRGVTSNNIQVAKINRFNSELNKRQTQMDLNNGVQQAYLDLVAAKSTYAAAQENLVALEQSFKFMKARYDSGNSDFYTYLESLNNKNRAEIELINAKYGIALRKKILNIYQGLE